MLKVQVEGEMKQVCHYIQDLQSHPCYNLIHQEVLDQKFTHEYIQVMCYIRYHPNHQEDKIVHLYLRDGQEVQIPLSNVSLTKMGNEVIVVGNSKEDEPVCEKKYQKGS